jgi:large subunit ribosomal protein L10
LEERKMSKPSPIISDKNKKVVKELTKLIDSYPIVGVVDMTNLPSPQLQKMKKSLRGKVLVRMGKGRLIKLALEKGSKDLSGLIEKVRGMPALVLTNDNPFKLYKNLSKSKSSAPAKAGQIAPKDVTVPEGKTPFAPGPIIGELGQLGIKSGIEDGKVAVKAAKTVVKEGEVFSGKVAEILTRLSILPMEVGLNIVAVWENGTVFDRKTLDIDEEAFMKDLVRLHSEALNLAVKIAYPSKDTIKLLITKAHRDASGLADGQDILTSENINRLLAKADAQANALKTEAKL